MIRFSALILVLVLSLFTLGGCARRGDVAELAKRQGVLEQAVVMNRTDTIELKDELHDHDMRLEFLEREAVRRGEPISPRRVVAEAKPVAGAVAKSEPVPEPVHEAATISPGIVYPPELPPSPAQNAAGTPAVKETPAARAPDKAQAGGLPAPAGTITAESAPSAVTGPESALVATPPPVSPIPRLTESSPSTPAPPRAPAPAPVRTEQNAYDAALQMYRTGRFAEAEAAFQAFLEVYSNSRLVPNALYWKGETFYARQNFTDAIFAFKDVQTRFPRDLKTPDSLLKTAMAYQKLGDAANASLHLAVLYEDWPKAEATLRAQRQGLKP